MTGGESELSPPTDLETRHMSAIRATHPSIRFWLLGTGLAAILLLVWTPFAALAADTDETEALRQCTIAIALHAQPPKFGELPVAATMIKGFSHPADRYDLRVELLIEMTLKDGTKSRQAGRCRYNKTEREVLETLLVDSTEE
jgi:hypothetical protein